MENSIQSITDTIIFTINKIYENIFASIDNNIYSILDDITFINTDILENNSFQRLFGTENTSGILLIANSLLLGIILYYSIKILLSNYTYMHVEAPLEFLFKIIIFGICMNSSWFIIGQIINIMSSLSSAIQELGGELFNKNICFSELINIINDKISYNTSANDVFTIDGFLKGIFTFSIFGLVLSYSLRYVIIRVFVLLGPFAFLSLSLNSTAWIFKTWIRNFVSLLFIQIMVAVVLVVLFSMDYSDNDLITKFLYIGGIYTLFKANTIVRELIGGISTDVQANVGNFFKLNK